MTISCSFHPGQAAHFQCNDCDINFCESCITSRKVETYGSVEKHYFCPACDAEAELIGVANILPPFWKKLGAIFSYPFQLSPLLLTVTLAAIGGFMSGSFLVRLVVFIVMLKYAYAVMIATAKGSLRSPTLTWKLINDDVFQVLKQYVIFGLVGFCGSLITSQTGPLAGKLFYMFITIFMPAIIMVLVATNSIIHAVNPALFVPIVWRIGLPYVLMYLFLMFLYTGPSYLLSLIPFDLSPKLAGFTILFVQQIYAIVSYHLMGYVLLQYHAEIGYPVEYEYFVKQGRTAGKSPKISEKQKLLNTIEVLIKGGHYAKALPLLREEIAVESPDINLSEKYYRLLQLADEKKKAGNYAPILLDQLVQKGRKKEAMELLTEMMGNNMSVPSDTAILKVADWYKQRGELKKAVDSYSYFLKNNKGHNAVPEMYFKLAQILHENGRNSAKAKKILMGLVKTFPHHNLVPQIKSYLSSMG